MKQKHIFIFVVVLGIFFPHVSKAQYLSLFGGIKNPTYANSSIRTGYIDESPNPDVIFAQTTIFKKTNYVVGISYDNFTHEKEIYLNAIVQVSLGEFYSFDMGATVGYPLQVPSIKGVTFLPGITGGFAISWKGIGTLVNNTQYIQVNNTRFGDGQNVDISIDKIDGYVKPSLSILFDVSKRIQFRVSGAYLKDFKIRESIGFSGKDNNGKYISDSEEMNAPNLSFTVNGASNSALPFNVKGFEFTFGVAMTFAKENSRSVKQQH